ncbi:MAG: dTMP kinase [Firmicutes bacterium]|nr:dTMP kinase [Bacillota bacterium]
MTNRSGKFITVEGCEGVGKSTQIRLLREYCAAHGIDAVFTREPGGTPIADKIRALILDPANAEMVALTELFLYAASRSQHTAELIVPALAAGKTVFCDRYTDSTLAYQGFARGLDKEIIRRLNAWAMGGTTDGTTIDYTLFIDLPPREGFLRKGGADPSDRMDSQNIDFHERVYAGFCAIAKSEPQRFIPVSGRGTEREVHERLVAALKERSFIQ